MAEYQCECGERYLSALAMGYCPCLTEDKYGRPKPIKGDDWIP